MKPNKRGQSLVELALILPLLLAVIFLIIDGAFIIQGQIAVSHAAREAARFAITYQPPQEECLDFNGDGNPKNDSWPWCPHKAHESDEEYYDRRVQMIKLVAQEATLGLRVEDVCFNEACITENANDPGLLGVRVWGFQRHDQPEELDRPGLQGLPVRVQVLHNVPLVVFSTFLPNPHIKVNGVTEMINEGIQVSEGNVLPPTFQPPPTPIIDPTYQATITPEPTATFGPSPTPTPLPVYHVELNFRTALNILPEDREHIVAAHVTDDQGDDVAGAQVTFRTDAGSFEYSGTGSQYETLSTGVDGTVRIPIYANEPLEAHIDAWLDYDKDGVIDTGVQAEPSDTALKTWDVITDTPYLIVSNHNPEPLEWIAVNLMDHDSGDNPHSLWWCPSMVTSTQVIQQLGSGLNVDGTTGDFEDVSVEVPAGVAGYYHIESHSGTGGCGQTSSLIAESSLIQIKEVPADLTITDLTIVTSPDARGTGLPLTVTVKIENLAPVPISGGPFDVDLYLNLEEAPRVRQLGDSKQWIQTMGPLETRVITYVVMPRQFGESNVWAQVDTSDYIFEGDSGGEDNNVYGPVDFEAQCGIFNDKRSDNFDGGLKDIWTSEGVGSNSSGSTSVNGNGELEISSYGTKIGGTDSFYYVYQNYDNDFDARLRLIDEPDTNNWAKVGLMIRENRLTNSPFAFAGINHSRNPAARQYLYRDYPGTGSSGVGSRPTVNLPFWSRIVRQGTQYTWYESDVADPDYNDWDVVGTAAIDRPLEMIGIANTSYQDDQLGTGIVDDFKICTADQGGGKIKPPGLVECHELVNVPGFEGNPATVFEYWNAGSKSPISYRRTSEEFYYGSFSMALYASMGSYPCSENNLNPYLYQNVRLPTDIYSTSTLVVDAAYFVDQSNFECSLSGPDADDKLHLLLQESNGTNITPPQLVRDGSVISQTWDTVAITLSEYVNLEDYAGDNVRVYWDGTHNGDTDGTVFYVDDVSAELCTVWPIPDPIPGTGTFGGRLSTLGEYNIPVMLPGADVWAYAQGGQVYHTQSIHDGTYRFYNIPEGTYLVYAEAWVEGQLRTAVTNVTVVADDPDPNLNVNLLLQ